MGEGRKNHATTGHGVDTGLACGGEGADKDDVEPQHDQAEAATAWSGIAPELSREAAPAPLLVGGRCVKGRSTPG